MRQHKWDKVYEAYAVDTKYVSISLGFHPQGEMDEIMPRTYKALHNNRPPRKFWGKSTK